MLEEFLRRELILKVKCLNLVGFCVKIGRKVQPCMGRKPFTVVISVLLH